MNIIIKVFFGSFILFFIFCSFGFCIPVNSNADIGKVLELNDSGLADAVKKLDNAMQIVQKNEEKKKRKIEFKNPVKIFDLSDKYSVISYNSKFDSGEDAIVGFLVVKTGKNIEVPGPIPHLIWKGETDISAFYSITDDVLCKYFREMGINDVYPIYSSMKLRNKIEAKADKIHYHSGNDINSGVVSEKFIDQSITRDVELKEALSKKADISMIMSLKQDDKQAPKPDLGTVGQLQAKVAELEKKIEKLNLILSGVVRKNNDIYFSNVNIHVLNGTGKTESANSTGNIIVGYNEGGNISGSHNIVAGTACKANAYGSIVSGKNNSALKPYGVSLGGSSNEVSEIFGASLGGKSNKASGKYSAVAGGEKNNAKGDFSIISGGKNRSVLNENPHFTQ
jgi:hypothetical protein